MTVQPLTPDGVEDKLAEVYALSTINRNAQADLIESGFKTWVSDNFSLDTPQTAFLTGMSSTAATNYGRNAALCFRNLLDIAFIYPTPPTPAPTKWLKMTNDLLISTNASGTLEVTGSLTFAVEWRS